MPTALAVGLVPDCHVALDVMARSSRPPPGREWHVPPGPGPSGVELPGTCRPGTPLPAWGRAGIAARQWPCRVVTVHPLSRVRMCGVELLWQGPSRDVTDHCDLMGASPSLQAFVYGHQAKQVHLRQQALALTG